MNATKTDIDTGRYGIKAIRRGSSVFGPAAGWTKSHGEIITGSREEMESKAAELNAKQVPNTWYSVEEME